MNFQPRFIRITEAHKYLGMCKTVFNREIRPHLTVITIGQHAEARARAFDRLDLDRLADEYKARMGSAPPKGEHLWQHTPQQDSIKEGATGTSTRNTSASEFAGLVKQVSSTKR